MNVDKVRCFQCGDMFEPWTNERYCSDTCHDAATRVGDPHETRLGAAGPEDCEGRAL